MKHTELRNGNKRDVMHRNNVENIWIRNEVKTDAHRNNIKHTGLRKKMRA
jgi:hypothetical protein